MKKFKFNDGQIIIAATKEEAIAQHNSVGYVSKKDLEQRLGKNFIVDSNSVFIKLKERLPLNTKRRLQRMGIIEEDTNAIFIAEWDAESYKLGDEKSKEKAINECLKKIKNYGKELSGFFNRMKHAVNMAYDSYKEGLDSIK